MEVFTIFVFFLKEVSKMSHWERHINNFKERYKNSKKFHFC